MGPLLARMGHASCPPPGGDAIGIRPLDVHLAGFRALGATVDQHGDIFDVKQTSAFRGKRVVLDYPSVMGTLNVMLASTLADGETTIINGACERCGAVVTKIERPFGEVFTPEEIEAAVKQCRPKVVGIVHAETSTGACQPMEEISRIVHANGALLLMDCVTSLAGLPVEIDPWQVDAAYSGTQKCLSCPPGLSPVTFSKVAADMIAARKTKIASWYFDTLLVRNYWGQSRAYHHTAPINMNYALHEALRQSLTEGLPARFARHRRNHLALRAGVEAMGLSFVVAEAHRLPMLNAIRIPDGADDKAVRGKLLHDYGIEIGGGLGAMAGKVWRVGLMGETSQPRNVLVFLAALEACLIGKVPAGAGVAAANAFYAL